LGTSSPGDSAVPLGAADRLHRLQRATAALAAATTTNQMATALFDEALRAVGAASGALWLAEPARDALVWAGGAGIESDIPATFAAIPLTSGLPACDVVQEAVVITFSSRAERDRRWPQIAGTPSRVEAVAALPLTVADRTFGCLAVGFADEREFTPEDLEFLVAVADQAAIAVDRARLFDAERTARELLEFLADASRALAQETDPVAVLSDLSRLAVPRLADWSSVYLPEDGRLERVAVTVRDRQDVADRLVRRFPIAPDADTPVAAAFRTGEVQRVAAITAEQVAAVSSDAELSEAVQLLTVQSALIVPVAAVGGRVVAAVTFAFTSPERTFTTQLSAATEDLCRRAAVAFESASRFQRQRRVATTLTEAVLPTAPDEVEGIEVAARYVPVEADAGDVGGDWYDSWVLPDGRLLLGVGDVAGHGIAAARAMAQLRHAARGWALHDPDPGTLLSHLNRVAAAESDGEVFATSIYAIVSPATGELRWASAGHPPPIVVTATGTRVLSRPPNPPLGVKPDISFEPRADRLEPGDMLVLYTDGVVEIPGRSIDEGIERLSGRARQIGLSPDLEAACHEVLEGCVADRQRTDDCCLLLARRTGAQ
jgi:serine phosphatase RsbU (regulator of sigma subunit)